MRPVAHAPFSFPIGIYTFFSIIIISKKIKKVKFVTIALEFDQEPILLFSSLLEFNAALLEPKHFKARLAPSADI